MCVCVRALTDLLDFVERVDGIACRHGHQLRHVACGVCVRVCACVCVCVCVCVHRPV